MHSPIIIHGSAFGVSANPPAKKFNFQEWMESLQALDARDAEERVGASQDLLLIMAKYDSVLTNDDKVSLGKIALLLDPENAGFDMFMKSLSLDDGWEF